MKKVLYSFGLLAIITGSSLSFQACNKIKDEITSKIPAITFDGDDVIVTVPVAQTGDSISTTEINIPIDIAAEITAHNTSGYSIGYGDVNTIKIKKITLEMEQGFDDSNNWTNFEGVYFATNTDLGLSKSLSYIGLWVGIDNDPANKFVPIELVFPEPQPNLKDYFDASGKASARYELKAKVRNSTTHPMKVRAIVEYELAFQ